MMVMRIRALPACLALGASALGSLPARAQPPLNDLRTNATVVTSSPFSHTADHTEATTSSDDPTACWIPLSALDTTIPAMEPSQTLWYRYDATEQVGLLTWGHRLVNENGFLDLSVYTLTASGLHLLACLSTDPYSSYTPDYLIRAQPGDTYFFMMSMITYPDDTLAEFSLVRTTEADAEARSLSVARAAYATDVGEVDAGEDFDISYEIGTRTPGWAGYVLVTLDTCSKGLADSAGRCTSRTRRAYVTFSTPTKGTTRVTAPGVGDFLAILTVVPQWTIDLNTANDRLEERFSALVDGLGFGIG